MKNKKTVIVTAVTALVLVIGGFLWFIPDRPITEEPNVDTPEVKIEYALESDDFDFLYNLLYIENEKEITLDEFSEGLTVLSAFFHFGEDITVKADADGYIATDIKGNALRFTPKEKGGYEVSVENTVISAFTVYAPSGSKVTIDGTELSYNSSAKNYSAFDVEKGKKKLTVEKDGCVTYEATVNVGTESEINVDLPYTDAYLEEYKQTASETLRNLMKICVSGDCDLSGYSFKNDCCKTAVTNTIDGIIRGIKEEAENITIGNIRFIDFSGEKVSRYNENDGSCIAKYQYDYTYTLNGKIHSDTGNALMTMEKLDGVWLLEDAYFTVDTIY